MALRDPRNKSRNNASRRTTSATRSKRAASSAKYNPKPSSSQSRSSKAGTGSKRVTTGKGGKVTSPRLKQALDSVKTKRTPAKTPSKATAAGNARVVAEAFKKTLKQRLALDKLEKAKKGTKGTGVRTARGSKPVQTAPDSNPAKRGAQGPRTAPQQGPSQKVNTRGLIGSKPKPKPKAPPKAATPKVSNVGSQIKQSNASKAAKTAANKIKQAGGTAAQIKRVLSAANPYALALTIIAKDIKDSKVADGTLKGKPNVPTGKQKTQPSANNYDNYNTMDPDGRIRSRKRVGPKIVGPKIVGPKIVGPKK